MGRRGGREGLQRWFAGGDPLFSHAGATGETLIAHIRVGFVLAMTAAPLLAYRQDPGDRTAAVQLTAAVVALSLALVVLILVRRHMLGGWLGLVSSVFDVSLVTFALATPLYLGVPQDAVLSLIIFEAYFIAIGATCLRYDVKLCWIAGLLAVAQYAGIVLYAEAHWPVEAAPFSWLAQASRLALMVVATGLAAVVVDRSRQLRRLSTIDRLTGVLNRGSFDERLNAELSRARRHGESLALVMIDVDHFKKFNDDLGHAAGDAALRAVTRVINAEIRRSDVLARYGGEEFVLIMPATSAEQALKKTEAIRDRVSKHNIVLPRTDALTARLTMSGGVSIFPGDGVTADELVDKADERLFEAKNTGRNRVVGPGAGMVVLKAG